MAAELSSGVRFHAARARGDQLGLVLVALLLLLALLPSLAADGFLLTRRLLCRGEESPPVRSDEGLRAVHLSFHRGTTSVAAGAHSARPLSLREREPSPPTLADARLRSTRTPSRWLEQRLWKHGFVGVRIGSILRPELSLGWLMILVGAAAVWAVVPAARAR